jgi:hypothetical protein
LDEMLNWDFILRVNLLKYPHIFPNMLHLAQYLYAYSDLNLL